MENPLLDVTTPPEAPHTAQAGAPFSEEDHEGVGLEFYAAILEKP